MTDDTSRGGMRSRDIVRATLLVCGALLAIWLLRSTMLILLAVFLATVFGVALSAGVDQLERRRVPRALGATLIVLAFFGCITALGLWLAPTIRAQSVELRQKLPVALERVQGWLDQKQSGLDNLLVDSAAAPAADSTRIAPAPSRPSAVRSRIEQETGHVSRFLFPVLHSTVVVLGGILFVVFLAIYFGIDPEMYRRGIVAVFPRDTQPNVVVVLDRIATVLRKWLVTQLIVMAVMGAASTAALLVLHVKAAVALGVLAGVVSFIPTIGGIVGAAPAVAMGFLDSPQKALIVAVVYLLIHFAGSHVLVPVLMRGGIDLPPALTLIAQAMLTAMFGFLGLMVAVPLLAVVLVIVRSTYVEPLNAALAENIVKS
jgi:predicted PurR-regulated permease PerM